MKRLDKDRELWLVLREKRKARHSLLLARVRQSARSKQTSPRPKPATSIVPLPSELTAERVAAREEIQAVILSTVRLLERGGTRVKLDFGPVRRIFPGGMLMLLAHLEVLSDYFPNRLTVSCHRGSVAAQLIRHFGFGSKLGVPENGNTPVRDDVTSWRFATGHQADGARLHEHIKDFAGQIGTSVPDGLYNALCEATTNVQHHAYPPESSRTLPSDIQRWWLFSRAQQATSSRPGTLYLAFYDVGVGIPESMRKCLDGLKEHAAALVQRALEAVGVSDGLGLDTDLLRLAVEHPRTSTGLPFRGKGLPEMKEFAASTPGGRMTIVSGYAQYSFRADDGVSSCIRCRSRILGTLILWSLPLHLQGGPS